MDELSGLSIILILPRGREGGTGRKQRRRGGVLWLLQPDSKTHYCSILRWRRNGSGYHSCLVLV